MVKHKMEFIMQRAYELHMKSLYRTYWLPIVMDAHSNTAMYNKGKDNIMFWGKTWKQWGEELF